MEHDMIRVAQQIRQYLAASGQHGGLVIRRELTKSHARQMVAIREARRAAKKAALLNESLIFFYRKPLTIIQCQDRLLFKQKTVLPSIRRSFRRQHRL